MDTGTEKESQSQLLAMEAGDGLLELANTPGVELANTSGVQVGRVSPCRDAEGTCGQGVSRGKGPAAGKRGIFPLPDQHSVSYFTLILQTKKLLFAYSVEKELKIWQS